MARSGKGKDNLTINVDRRLKGYVFLRGKRLDLTMSKFAGKVMEWWIASGAPPVTEGEQKMSALRWDAQRRWEDELETQATAEAGTPLVAPKRR
jgi:hypothetical protein